MRWRDGTGLAYWNGFEVPQNLVCDPDNVTATDIINETNAEVRRCYQEKLGSENVSVTNAPKRESNFSLTSIEL